MFGIGDWVWYVAALVFRTVTRVELTDRGQGSRLGFDIGIRVRFQNQYLDWVSGRWESDFVTGIDVEVGFRIRVRVKVRFWDRIIIFGINKY